MRKSYLTANGSFYNLESIDALIKWMGSYALVINNQKMPISEEDGKEIIKQLAGVKPEEKRECEHTFSPKERLTNDCHHIFCSSCGLKSVLLTKPSDAS